MLNSGSSVFEKLSLAFKSLSVITLAFSAAAFLILAPLKTAVGGMRVSFTTLDNPVQICLVLFLFGVLFGFFAKKRPAEKGKIPAAAIFCLTYLVYLNSGVMTSFDSRWTLPTARSMITELNTDLDEYRSEIAEGDYRIEHIGSHIYSAFPIGVPVVCLPFIWLFNDDVLRDSYPDIERLIASIFMAGAVVLVYLLSSRITGDGRASLLLSFIFAFCTSVWSVASRGLWQQGPSILMLTLALLLIISARKRPGLIQYAGLPLALSFVIRPTNAISLVVLSVFVALEGKKYLFRFLLWTFPPILLFLIHNLSVYHSLLSPYYWPKRIGALQNFLAAAAGQWISPSRGLLVFTPVFLFSFLGLMTKLRSKKMERLDRFLLAIIGLHWLSISSFAHWWGGHSYGPRLFADMIPYFMYFLASGVISWSGLKGARKPLWGTVFFVLLAMSFFVHSRGATTQSVYRWNHSPVDVDAAPERIWDWSDPQFLRGIVEPASSNELISDRLVSSVVTGRPG